MNDDNPTRSEYERILASLDGLPDTTHTKPSTIRTVSFIGTCKSWIVTTYRMRELGDTVFLETTGADGIQLVLPPAVVDAIVRQRDSLTTVVRRKIGKANAEARKAAGLQPGFMKHKRGKAAR